MKRVGSAKQIISSSSSISKKRHGESKGQSGRQRVRHLAWLISDDCSGFTPCDLYLLLEITIRNEWEFLNSLFAHIISQVVYLFAGALGSAADVLLSFHAPPETSESSPLGTLCHSCCPETVDRNASKCTDEASHKEQTDTTYCYCNKVWSDHRSENDCISECHLILSITLIFYLREHVWCFYINVILSSNHCPKS